MIWLTRPQVHQLADAIDPRYRALVILAAHTGARWTELTTLRWIDVRTNYPLDDGAISAPGRLRIRPPTPVDQEKEPASRGRSRPRPGGRTIALDHETIDALHAHRELVGARARDLVFTSPGGTRGAGGPLSSANLARVSGSVRCQPPAWTRPGPTTTGRASTIMPTSALCRPWQ